MAQGQLKGISAKKNTSAASRHAQKSAASTKKGKRYVAPKKKDAVKSAALHKVSLVGVSHLDVNLRCKFIGAECKDQQKY